MSGIENEVEVPAETNAVRIENARVVTPQTVVNGVVKIAGDRIVAVGKNHVKHSDQSERHGAKDIRRIDAEERLVLPGIVDLHGDEIEDHLFPRSEARIGFPLALQTGDRANVAAGVTTKFHAVSFRNVPSGNRTPELATDLSEAIADADELLADNRIHARCEITAANAVQAVERVIKAGVADLVSVMNHTPGQGQFRDLGDFEDWYARYDELPRAEAKQRYDRKTSVSETTLREHTRRILNRAGEADIPSAVHDSEHPADLERLAEHGVDICEYPVTMAAAKASHDLGMTTAMGAPNLVRGGSTKGNLGTAEAIDEGVVDVLCADYHPPSLLAAPFMDTGESLPERVARVTSAPAEAVGLDDRGRIVEGARADLIIVDPDPLPTVHRAFVAGQEVYRAEGDS